MDASSQSRAEPAAGFASRLRGLFFSRRLEIGLLAVIPAAFLVRPGGMFGAYWLLGEVLSALLLLCGIALRAWAGGCAGGHTGESQIQAPRLATGGIYAHVRNPIYLGTILIGLGMVGLIGDLRLLPLCLFTFALLYIMIVPAEEKFLRATFGAEYEAYCQAVPRWIPRPARWKQNRRAAFHWGVIAAEARLAAILIVVFGLIKCAAYLK
jgi:protein-S-isoprenylcysteine O-methyltransferase Ste14